MNKITVINPGLFSTFQDEGRENHQHIGMPVGGAMDKYALQLANYLVSNQTNEACLEMTLTGATLRFNFDTNIAITGGKCVVLLNGKQAKSHRTLVIKTNDQIDIQNITEGARSYLAIAGGFNLPIIMASKSTYIKGKLGGFKGRALMVGDEIEINKISKKCKRRRISRKHIPQYPQHVELRIIPGPEKDRFEWEGIKHFLCSDYELSPQCDRMGYRLNGPKIGQINNNADIISSAISFGTIQVPSDGKPIIMMADRQTTGGYTRIAQVVSADHHILAQLKPGDKIRFKEVTLNEAHQLYKKMKDILNKYQ
ncbi:biotin-dependent carboxyltransferase family protein [Carboxylicivirga sp. N1Y90]|uniref:5-oxoprolinase subunit C family protein n=1 Tax=Carboxylicivirga fragile TaxID=3417571 RepID=UPI003D327DCC|nr:biotin-dependent carboxyltransferase [Marinilabiliaceae bacterium N1Y90]